MAETSVATVLQPRLRAVFISNGPSAETQGFELDRTNQPKH
jgi:hypothetical protein